MMPGKIANQGYFTKFSWAFPNKFPQLGVGGWIPKPRKLKPDSSMMA